MRDTPQDILKTLKSRYADEKDLRVLAKDILAAHPLVESVNFGSVVLACGRNGACPTWYSVMIPSMWSVSQLIW